MNFLAPVKIMIPKPPFNNYCGRFERCPTDEAGSGSLLGSGAIGAGGSRAAALYSFSVHNKDIRQTNAVPFQCKQI